MSEKSTVCNYRKSKFMAGTIAALAFSIATNSSAFAGDIRTTDDLIAISSNLADTYSLTTNLNLAGIERGGDVWTYVSGTFTGSFNGNGYTISNLIAPLFDVIGDGTGNGSVSNLGLKTTSGGITGDANNNSVGVLAGTLASQSTVNEVAVSGSISTVPADVAGGLVGVVQSGATVNNSSSSVSISTVGVGEAQSFSGGLVGVLDGGSISNSTSTGSVSSTSGNTNAGGLVGAAYEGTIENSSSTGAVTIGSEGSEATGGNVGGLVGYASGSTISNSSASGAVTNVGGANATGGLVGAMPVWGEITRSAATGNVNSTGSNTGGLLGTGENVTVENSSASGSVAVNATGALSNVGGLVGGTIVMVIQSSASGSVAVTSADSVSCVGGLVGCGYGVQNSSASGSVSVTATSTVSNIGGLLGQAQSPMVERNSASGNVTVNSSNGSIASVGGLVGNGKGITNSSASGSVTVISETSNAENVGGLVGLNTDIEISTSSASGDVFVSGNETSGVGGLVGRSGDVVDSNASGTVTMVGYAENIGGLVGTGGNISNSSASGNVIALSSSWVGGLAGIVATLENTAASGNVSGLQYVGKLAGYVDWRTLDSLSTGSANGEFDAVLVYDPGPIEYTDGPQGLLGEVGPTLRPDPVTEIAVGAELLNTENDPLTWGESQYVNAGLPYLLALRASGFYEETTPPVASGKATKVTYLSTIAKLFLYLDGNPTIQITVEDFNFLYVIGVNESNLPILLELLKKIDLRTLSTETIQKIVVDADSLIAKK